MTKNTESKRASKGHEPVASKYMTPEAIEHRIKYMESQIKNKINEREVIKSGIREAMDTLIDGADKDVVDERVSALNHKYIIISTRIYAMRQAIKRWLRVKAEREKELGIISTTDNETSAES